MSTYPRDFSSDQILSILSQAKTATAIHTTDDMVIEMANDAMISIWGKDKSVIGKPIEVALPELKGQPFLKMLQDVLHTGITASGSDTRADLVVNGELKPFYFDFEYKAITNSAGEVTCVLHTAMDVTERYLSRQRELELEAELQAMNEELAAANEELAASNEAMAATNEELVSTNEELASTNEELISTNEDLGQSQRDLIALNNELMESEARLRSVITQAPVGICIIRASDLMIEGVNDAYLELMGKQRHEFENRTIWQAVPEAAAAYAPVMNQVAETGVAFKLNEHELMLVRNGMPETVFVNFVYEPIRGADDVINAVMVIGIDVTEQVTARQKIQQSRARLNNMVMTAPIAMTVLKGPDMIIELANQPMYDLWQRKPAHVIDKKLLDVFPELHNQQFPALLQKVLNTGERISLPESPVTIATPDEEMNYLVDFSYDPLFDLNGNVEAVLATVIDVTERVNARDELEKARDIMKQAIDSAGMGTWTADILTDQLMVSGQGKKLHGIPHHIDLTLSQSLSLVAPDYVERVTSAIQSAIQNGNAFDVEYMINPMDGSKPKWLKSTGKAYYDDEGKAISISGTMIDVTESKIADQQKDDFISIASHELKTPVTSLKAALQLMERMKDNPSPQILPKLIEQSNRSMDKISTLIEDLLNLSRMNEGQLRLEKAEFVIAEMIGQCCSHVRAAGKHALLLRGDEALSVIADEHRIDQVIVNMVNNAVKYAPNSKDIILTVEKTDGWAKVSVKDQGPGIAPEKLAHLFERYYRTDASGYQNSGLGLGLYISAEIIRKHGGEIGVDSEVGKGSTFWFTLPL